MRLMNKITATVLTILILTLSLSACSKEGINDFLDETTLGIWGRLLLDERAHNIVEYVDSNTLEYQGNTYYLAPVMFIRDTPTEVQEDRGYEYIGWSGPRFFYINTYYGDSKDLPNIIYETRLELTYFREDYDYKTDTFKLEGTGDIICFGKDLIETSQKVSNNRVQEYILLSSTTHTSLDIKLAIIYDSGIWYAMSMNLAYFELSENLVKILMKNQIIP